MPGHAKFKEWPQNHETVDMVLTFVPYIPCPDTKIWGEFCGLVESLPNIVPITGTFAEFPDPITVPTHGFSIPDIQ